MRFSLSEKKTRKKDHWKCHNAKWYNKSSSFAQICLLILNFASYILTLPKFCPFPHSLPPEKERRELLPKTLAIWQKWWLAFFRWPKGNSKSKQKHFLSMSYIHVAKVWCQWLIYLFLTYILTYLLWLIARAPETLNCFQHSPLIPPKTPSP